MQANDLVRVAIKCGRCRRLLRRVQVTDAGAVILEGRVSAEGAPRRASGARSLLPGAPALAADCYVTDPDWHPGTSPDAAGAQARFTFVCRGRNHVTRTPLTRGKLEALCQAAAEGSREVLL